ncbi:unnamed protein product [Chondrus crispus]|uniref:Uncharacterized protein n=1 Tax=Chondrus crispus TaxID=2769 RepID=R7QHG5_CHOCR|nr:unnamed protein product [Chondrus crispus]CDF37962.1 unnamed protein product [Chondrus crispus]|eukprot:XP_005717831.1 unnamed protein product [Chondrus crispus]
MSAPPAPLARTSSHLRLRECRPMANPTPPDMPLSAPGKRRPSLTSPPLPASDLTLKPPPYTTAAPLPVSRRRRLILYSVAFATMLAMSSVLDVRRAALKHRHSKVQLSLPSASSLSSLPNVDDHQESPVSAADLHPNEKNPSVSLRPGDPYLPDADTHTANLSAPTVAKGQVAADPDQPPVVKGDPVLSEQELKDDVDQLIAHVAQEEENGAANATTPTSPLPDPPADPATENKPDPAVPVPKPVQTIANTFLGLAADPPPAAATPDGSAQPNTTADGTEVRLNSEESFSSSQKRLQVLLADDSVKRFVDENDLRTLEALALQATRGDCEQRSGSEGGSLFKTDAEAASNVDIERHDPLWGAWCLFMGSYKTDAMRDYVTKQRVIEEKILTAKGSADANVTAVASAFDPHAATLDDVMTPEQQSAMREKMDTIAAHLREYDVRYLAALALQATFGDCGPYGSEAVAAAKEPESTVELRKLAEPLLDQIVVRRQGAQWGAWCVLQGKKRTLAASELSQRVDLLVNQLSKSQAAIQSGLPDGLPGQSEAAPASVKTVDAAATSKELVAS